MATLYIKIGKTQNGYQIWGTLSNKVYGRPFSTVEEYNRFIDDLDGYIYGHDNGFDLAFIPKKSLDAFVAWHHAPENLNMRIVPSNDFRQSNVLRVEAILPQARCFARPRDKEGERLVGMEYGRILAEQGSWYLFDYCVRKQCAACPVYHRIVSEPNAS